MASNPSPGASAPENNTHETYEEIVENGLWLESRGDYSRYAVGAEESVWVNEVTEEISDPDDEVYDDAEEGC